jgi:putative inorganic carbon (HCO3(-)) transporter
MDPSGPNNLRQVSIFRKSAAFIVHWELLILIVCSPAFLFPRLALLPLLLILPFLWICRWVARGHFIPRTPLDVPILLLLIMAQVSLYATYSIEQSLPKISGVLFGIGLFYALVERLNHERVLRTGTILFLLAGTGLSVLALVGTHWNRKLAWLNPLLDRLPPRITQLPGAEGGFHSNEIAGVLLWILPLAFCTLAGVILHRKKDDVENRAGRILLIVASSAALSGTFVLFLTQSRGAWIGFAVATLLCILWLMRERFRVASGWLALLYISLIVVAVGLAVARPEVILGETVFEAEGTMLSAVSLAGRVEIWSRAIYGIQDFPFTGMGMNTFREVVHILYPLFIISPEFELGHAHNEYLQAALDLGLPGLIAYLSLHIGAFWMLVRLAGQKPSTGLSVRAQRAMIAGLGGGLLAHLIYGLTDAVALGAKPGFLWWWLLALIAALYKIQVTGVREQEEQLSADSQQRTAKNLKAKT